MSFLFLLLGIVVFGMALRSFAHPVVRKLGGAVLLVALGYGLYKLTNIIWLGVLLALAWPLLLQPWLGILTQVRPLRLPLRKTLRFKTAPANEDFPPLEELSEEIEELGFEYANDTGWDWENFTQFFRIFSNAPERTQARICVNQIEDLYMFYISLVSWSRDGTAYVTTNDAWTSTNDVFSYGLVAHPGLKLNRFPYALDFQDMMKSHREFLKDNGLSVETLAELDMDEAMGQIEGDMTKQLRHNLSLGLLEKSGEDEVRYTLKGLFFVWGQALKDILRFV